MLPVFTSHLGILQGCGLLLNSGFEADESYGQVTNFGHLIAGRPRASKLNFSKPQSLSVSN